LPTTRGVKHSKTSTEFTLFLLLQSEPLAAFRRRRHTSSLRTLSRTATPPIEPEAFGCASYLPARLHRPQRPLRYHPRPLRATLQCSPSRDHSPLHSHQRRTHPYLRTRDTHSFNPCQHSRIYTPLRGAIIPQHLHNIYHHRPLTSGHRNTFQKTGYKRMALKLTDTQGWAPRLSIYHQPPSSILTRREQMRHAPSCVRNW